MIQRRSAKAFLLAISAVLTLASALPAGASASPAWKFNGTALVGSETLISHALESSITIPGLTTTCKPFVYVMTISNSAGTGTGSVTSVPLSNCSTNTKACTVKSITAQALPWTASLTTVGGKNYIVIKGIKVGILYAGAECALEGIEVVVKGSAGGLIDNATESATFSSSSFKATGTALSALGEAVEWSGVFTMIATGAHIGQSISVS